MEVNVFNTTWKADVTDDVMQLDDVLEMNVLPDGGAQDFVQFIDVNNPNRDPITYEKNSTNFKQIFEALKSKNKAGVGGRKRRRKRKSKRKTKRKRKSKRKTKRKTKRKRRRRRRR